MVERIVSFFPGATEMLYELGAQDMLYGVTQQCTRPADARYKPRVIRSVLDTDGMSGIQIDQAVGSMLEDKKDAFILDEKALLDANPDMIIFQDTCEVCAAYTNLADRALEILKTKPLLHPMNPHGITDILDCITRLAETIGKKSKGEYLRKLLEEKINAIKYRDFKNSPRVLALEWIDPPFAPGHWIPEMIEIAGGINLAGMPGERSYKITPEEIAACDPDVVILMPCGFETDRTVTEYKNAKHILDKTESKVFAVDAAYFSGPGAGCATGIEILSKILHPVESYGIKVPANSYKAIG